MHKSGKTETCVYQGAGNEKDEDITFLDNIKSKLTDYKPPYQITDNIVNLLTQISELLGRWSASIQGELSPELRRKNRIKTIQASLAIENNTLSVDQVTTLVEGKRVMGLPHEILEVKNAVCSVFIEFILTAIRDELNDGINDGIKLSETDKSVLKEIKKNPELTVQQLTDTIQRSLRTLERSIKKLKDQKYIKRQGSKKSGHWVLLKK